MSDSMMTEEYNLAYMRGMVYRQLAESIFQVDEQFAEKMVNGSFISMLRTLLGPLGDHSVDQSIKKLEGYIAKLEGLSLPEIILEINIEYNRLFVGPGHLPSPPYESVYLTKDETNKDGQVMGDSTLDVIKQYRDSGFVLQEDFPELPDHIGVELDFMSCLCFSEASMIKENKMDEALELVRRQNKFINAHLDNWISDFVDAVCHSPLSKFYREIAKIIHFWIKLDKEFLYEKHEAVVV